MTDSASNSDVATYRKIPRELEETNADGHRRPIYWRDRPIHSLAKLFILRKIATDPTLTHWGIQIGESYIWELEVQDGKVAHHVGVWEVPQKGDKVSFVGTENDDDPSITESSRGEEIGQTNMTDCEIRVQGKKSCSTQHCRRNRELTHLVAEQVVQDMNNSQVRSPIDKILQFYSPTHPIRDIQRLSPKWRKEHPYDEVNNNCQNFAKRLVEAIQTTNESEDSETSQATPSFQDKPTAKKKGQFARAAYWSSQVTPTLP